GTLFLIGPRRYGKTSILAIAEEEARKKGVLVLRVNAEAYPTLDLLVQELLAKAAGSLGGNVQEAGERIGRFFGRLRPSVAYDVLDQSWSVSVAAAAEAAPTQATLLVDALDGLERLALEAGQRAVVIIDEFQQVVAQEGVGAEQQLRAAIQTHRQVGYVFAGFGTRALVDMTSDPARPFYRMGERRFVGPVPRDDFRPFLRRGFTEAGLRVDQAGVEAILDAAEDVPYNVQRLAHACWSALRDQPDARLTAPFVQATLERAVRQEDPFYTQLWNGLSRTQQKALLAVVRRGGAGLYARDSLAAAGLGQSTMQTALAALERTSVLRTDGESASNRYRFEDPFFAAWIRLVMPAALVRPR
ncbi:MAG TPA: hypothetical protein VFI96_05680, partial [Longimicrobiaceae bacterium]|nr:hypothetical protein [Longimicrobiaceae bacterium]